MDPPSSNDLRLLQDCVQDMKQSAEAIGTVLMEIKDNDVSFNQRLTTLEQHYHNDLNGLSKKLQSFQQELDFMKITMNHLSETQKTMLTDRVSAAKATKINSVKRTTSPDENDDDEDEDVQHRVRINGEDDSGVNLETHVYSSNTSDKDSNQSRPSRLSIVNKQNVVDNDFVQERIHQFVEDASNLCDNSTRETSSLSNNDDSFNKSWQQVDDDEIRFGIPNKPNAATSNDSNTNSIAYDCYELASELLQCERNLCNSLSSLQLHVYDPLKRETNFISSRDLNLAFPSEIFRIYEQHCIHLHKCQQLINDWCGSLESFIDLFSASYEEGGYLSSLVNDYVSVFPLAINTLTEHFYDNSNCLKFITRYHIMKNPNIRPTKTLNLLTLKTYMASPFDAYKRYRHIFRRFVETDTLTHKSKNKVELLLQSFKEILQEYHSKDVPIPSTLTPPLKPQRNKYMKKIVNTEQVSTLQHSYSEIVVVPTPFEKKPHFERQRQASTSRKQRKMQLAYSGGSEANLHKRTESDEAVNDISNQLDAISEPSIFRESKSNVVQSYSCSGLAPMYAQITESNNSNYSTITKRNRRSLSKQVGGIKNSVAAFFSKRKNERRFSDFDKKL